MKMMRNMINKVTLLAAGVALLSSCESFLDEMPDNRTTIDSVEKIGMLLVSAYPEGHPLVMHELMSDNVIDNGRNRSVGFLEFEDFYLFRETSDTRETSPEGMWQSCYKAIGSANHALAAMDELIAAGVTTEEEVASMRAEALMSRAYTHFLLVNTFCQAYNEQSSTTDMGIPYVVEPEKSVFGNYERGTVADVYAKIEADIKAAMPILDDSKYTQPKYHFTRKAAAAFAAQFYLYYCKYPEAAQYATDVLGEDPTSQFRNWELFTGTSSSEYTNAYNSKEEGANIFMQGVPGVAFRMWSGRYVMTLQKSGEVVDCPGPWGDTNLANYGTLYGNSSLNSYFFPKQTEIFMYTDVVAGIGYPYVITVAYTVEKTIIDRAEAYAMMGEYEKAAQDLNYFYRQGGNNTSLSAEEIAAYYAAGGSPNCLKLAPRFTVQDGMQNYLVQACLHARRIAAVHEGTRTQDLKRYGVAYTHFCDGAENITIEPYDNRLAIQLPKPVISAGLPANPR